MTDARWLLTHAVREDDLLDFVIDTAHAFGWLAFHPLSARLARGVTITPMRGDPGFFDVTAIRPPDVLFAELKSERGTASEGQRGWHEAAKACPGVHFRLWRPRDQDAIVAFMRDPEAG